MSRLTSAQALEIYTMAMSGKSHATIASTFGVSKALVSHIKTGRLWAHVTQALVAQAPAYSE